LFFSQRELKALENPVFKLAGGEVHNNLSSDCTLLKGLKAEPVCRRQADDVGVFSEKSFNSTLYLTAT